MKQVWDGKTALPIEPPFEKSAASVLFDGKADKETIAFVENHLRSREPLAGDNAARIRLTLI